MINDQNAIFRDDKRWVEKLAEEDVFEYYVTDWITDYNRGALTKEDILNVTKKVSRCRGTLFLLDEIKQRFN